MLEHLANYSLDYIIYCETMHGLLGALAFCVGYYLTWTILSRAWPGQHIYLSPWLLGAFLASLSHTIIDFMIPHPEFVF